MQKHLVFLIEKSVEYKMETIALKVNDEQS